MQGSSSYRRPNRGRPRRGAPKRDAVATALAAQVMVCIVLLIAAVSAKKMDAVRYYAIRDQYDEMVTEAGDLASGESGSMQGVQGAFASIENWITSFVQRFSGAPDPPQPEPEPESGDSPDGGEAEGFAYNYLDAVGADKVVQTGGQGGPFPAGGQGSRSKSPPEGSTLAAVELAGKLLPPVTGLITSEFSYRAHPVNGEDDFHTGMDIAAEEGRDILAALPGEVVEVGESEVYGNYIVLQHAINLRTFYAHCSEIIAEEGMAVRQGERIAKVGSTGITTGPHLHFSLVVEGQFADPYWVLKDNIKLVGE